MQDWHNYGREWLGLLLLFGIDIEFLPLLCVVICQHMPWTDNCVELPDVRVAVQVPVDVSHLPVIIDHICSDVWRKDNAVELSVILAIWMQLEVSFGASATAASASATASTHYWLSKLFV